MLLMELLELLILAVVERQLEEDRKWSHRGSPCGSWSGCEVLELLVIGAGEGGVTVANGR